MTTARMVQVFVSHHHSYEEDIFTARLVADLEAAGASVWVDTKGITSDDFVQKINDGLEGRQWLVLVMTPQSVVAKWVQREVNAALSEVTAGRMLGVIPIVMTLTSEHDIPMLWRPLHRYDATHAYEPARDDLFRAIELSDLDALQPHSPLPEVPGHLARLGFRGVNVNGIPAIIPPLRGVSAGPFLMGSDNVKDKQAWDDEQPQHHAYVAGFEMAAYPVTVAEYQLAVRSGAVREPPESGSVTWQKQQQHLDHPVVSVSWADAMKYISWLIIATGRRDWRLPTEAEWEKAARWDVKLSASRIYPWGDTFDQNRCNTRESGIGAIVPVGSYPIIDVERSGASSFGVEDMTGNIWEWTGSIFKPYPYNMADGREDQNSTEDRVLRGGSRDDYAWRARAAFRHRLGPAITGRYWGFRLAVGLAASS